MSSVKALKLVVAVAAFAVSGSAAQAQSKASLWEGAYIGVHAGGDFGKFTFKNASGSESISGITGGLHAGYNWQAGSIVYGIEGDADLSGAKKSFTSPGNSDEVSNNFLGSLRGRIGFASDAALFYATGGLAFGTIKDSFRNGAVSGSYSDTRTGYAIGAGVEYAFSSNMSARIEGLHYGFKDVFKDQIGTGLKYDANVVRAGLSYKF
jgi:outer membrane immunogenic protein